MKNISEPYKYLQSDSTKLNTTNQYTPYVPVNNSAGLSELQQATTNILSHNMQWGFTQSKLQVKRQKLDEKNWQLTVINPKTRKIILQAEGHGDTIFAQEDNLARMAETLLLQDLKIQTEFND